MLDPDISIIQYLQLSSATLLKIMSVDISIVIVATKYGEIQDPII